SGLVAEAEDTALVVVVEGAVLEGEGVVDGEGSGSDDGVAGEGVGGGDREVARTVLGEGAGAADHAGDDGVIGAIEDKRGVVDDGAGESAGGAGVTDLQRAGADGGCAGEGVVASKLEGARAGFGE